MPENSVRVDYAKAMLESAYDVSSCGLGVQRQLVKTLVNDPNQISGNEYLKEALVAGARSNLITNAKAAGKQVFSTYHASNIEYALQQLDYASKDIDKSVLTALANDGHYERAGAVKSTLHEAVGMFAKLAEKGYFSRSPSRHAVEKYLKRGLGMEFGATLGTEGVKFDYGRLSGDIKGVMLGDARKECVRFHSGKLFVMANITDLAQEALVEEAGKFGSMQCFAGLKKDAELLARWKELFNEDLPAPDALVSSSKKVIDSASDFLGLRRGP